MIHVQSMGLGGYRLQPCIVCIGLLAFLPGRNMSIATMQRWVTRWRMAKLSARDVML